MYGNVNAMASESLPSVSSILMSHISVTLLSEQVGSHGQKIQNCFNHMRVSNVNIIPSEIKHIFIMQHLGIIILH